MSFNIQRFKSEGLNQGGARPSLFEIELTFPGAVTGPFVAQKGRFVCSASQLPASLIGEVRAPYFGRFIKLKGDREFQDWPVTVMNDEDFLLRDAFERWQNLENYLESNIMDPAFAGEAYKVDMAIHQFYKAGDPGSDGEISRTYRMHGAWPVTVGAIVVDWSDQNRIEMFDVTFAYDYFTLDGPTNTVGPPW